MILRSATFLSVLSNCVLSSSKRTCCGFLIFLAIAPLWGCGSVIGVASASSPNNSTKSGQLVVTPSQISFGMVNIGNNKNQLATMTNSGGSALQVTQASATGTGFSVIGLNFPIILVPGQSQNLTILFTAKSAGPVTGTLAIANNGSTPKVNVALSAFSNTGPSTGTITAIPANLNFGNVTIASQQSLPETLTNTGGTTVAVTQVTPSGSGYSVTGLSLPLVLGPSQSQEFNVIFSPLSAGGSIGALTIANTGTIPLVNVPLSGNGVTAGLLTTNPASLNFGNVTIASQQQLSETVTNTRGVSVSISQATVSGTGFSMTSWAPQVLTPGQHYTFSVTFTPPSTGNYVGDVSVVSNASNPNLSVPLSGTGTPEPQGQLAVTPTTMAFGNVMVGANAQMQGTLTASGTSVTVTSDTLNGAAFALSGLPSFPIVIPAGQNVQYTVTFTPTATGAASGSLSFTSNASNSPTVESFAGTGILPLPLVPPSFFGLIVHQEKHFPYTGFNFGSLRFWDDNASWPYIQTGPTTFNWTPINQYLSDLHAANINTALYTLALFPPWAAGTSTDPQPCDNVEGKIFPNNCNPPSDLDPTGTGTDQTWRNWIAAIATHVNSLAPSEYAHIEYWEVWNEFYRSDTLQPGYSTTPISWRGTYAQLVRMTQDLNCIVTGRIQTITTNGNEPCSDVLASVGLTTPVDPSAMIVSPSGAAGKKPFSFAVEQNFLYCNDAPPQSAECTTGNAGADAVDIINIHGYTQHEPVEGSWQEWADNVKNGLQPPELGKPLMMGEGSFGDPETDSSNDFKDLQSQAGVVARYNLMAWSLGFSTDYWYSYDATQQAVGNLGYGTLFLPDGYQDCNDSSGCTLPSGVAWQQTYDWMVGATMSTPCSNQGTIWTCVLERTSPSGYQAEAIWDNSSQYFCSSGTCPTHEVAASNMYTQYRDLAGHTTQIRSDTVPIGSLPILVENR